MFINFYGKHNFSEQLMKSVTLKNITIIYNISCFLCDVNPYYIYK